MEFIGVDPGKKGGISFIDNDGIISSFPLNEKNILLVISKIENRNKVIITIEKVHAMPAQGVVSTFSFGENYGIVQGMFKAFNLKYDLVLPQKWKKEFLLIGLDKQSSIEKCEELFDYLDLIPENKRKPQDGLAESALICEYGRRKYKNILTEGA